MAFDPYHGTRRLVGAAIALVALAAAMPAAAAESGDCAGLDFDAKRPVALARISSAAAQAHFVRGGLDDASCPADTAACRSRAYLVPGDLVLAGRTAGAYSCVTSQSLRTYGQVPISGWIASAALVPVAAAPALAPADWIGTWSVAGGRITIRPAKSGNPGGKPSGTLAIAAEHAYPVAGGVRSTEISAEAAPAGGVLAFADDGATPFDKAPDGSCLFRMQRLDALLVVEDNGQCGDGMVSFTGLYQRKP